MGICFEWKWRLVKCSQVWYPPYIKEILRTSLYYPFTAFLSCFIFLINPNACLSLQHCLHDSDNDMSNQIGLASGMWVFFRVE